jgi:hypothetical protein
VVSDPLVEVCRHAQAAGSAVAAALHAIDRLPPAVPAHPGTAGDLAAIRASLLEAGRLIDRAERLAYPLPAMAEPESPEEIR